MSILIFPKPPYNTGDKTETKKVFKVLTILSVNLGDLKKDKKFCKKDAMWQTVTDEKWCLQIFFCFEVIPPYIFLKNGINI